MEPASFWHFLSGDAGQNNLLFPKPEIASGSQIIFEIMPLESRLFYLEIMASQPEIPLLSTYAFGNNAVVKVRG